jgi:hypothetical protein
MYHQLPKYLIKQYFFQVYIVAILAYTLYFWFGEACHQPRGFHDLTQGYFYGVFFNFPLWFMLYCICGMFATTLLKTYKVILQITLTIILILFVIPIVFKLGSEYWNSVIPFFSLANFIFCYAIFIHFRKKFNLEKEVN